MTTQRMPASYRYFSALMLLAPLGIAAVVAWPRRSAPPEQITAAPAPVAPVEVSYKTRRWVDTSGFSTVTNQMPRWAPDASLERIATYWRGVGHRLSARLDENFGISSPEYQVQILALKASLLNYDGEPDKAYAMLEECRALAESNPELAAEWLYTVIAFQGVTALRRGETDNCVLCRGESSCILPLAPGAVHTKPIGSRLAIKHFTEYLNRFPDDLEIRWLLNIAHMTLGEHPAGVAPQYRIALDRYESAEHGIGKFRDIGDRVGINRLNQAGGTILDDFDNDGLLDIVFTTMDPTGSMVFYRNRGNGTFEDRTEQAGLTGQLGGLYCVQADYNNDGHLDIFIPRGAWVLPPMRPTLLRNNGNGTFTDVTAEAGLLAPVNAITAQWVDYDNDGWLDLFVCGERQANRLYHNRGNGTFEEVAAAAGLALPGGTWKGATWADFDGDRFPDLFLNDLAGAARLFRNNGNGKFTDITASAGIAGPVGGFSCWAFDFDNDGRPDIFATCYKHSVATVVQGLMGEPHTDGTNRLYRNLDGKTFRDVTKDAGLDAVFATMGSNFGDFDNDGYLDFYLGTGNPHFSMLVPNRMFRNLGGRRFAEITGSSGTGHLQKGHAVACGDWRRCGAIDIVIEMGGAVNGDRYHNVLFRNPGNDNNWLNVKLIGQKTNRSAIGARIKVVTAGPNAKTVYRWVSTGSSFGANPLEQHLGLGKTDRIAVLEIDWPTSGTTQTFRDLAPNQYLEVTEFATDYRRREFKPIVVPE
ncbi:Peptidylprolyl isomerase OS=Solibacter usitatus (strain Ellin6076) GN=Acid_1957 PE=4 SV=1: VCBS: VCBS: VCBS: UnbV_ASPIC [Gemmata massiliana]|uniref:ASPIC/UnbV domain-containing protein n=2 Tax=Gemmata massiliana TaxID=1210884 RepID=A0A6P2D797_9BACT|nr:Peptidylprolyl isomerase OS=Solibacter usitatus (strain Ellin6076) GN=Acid_1957 PE=4 SV=1: VCBS: VCBS: VCBS: UnbV_ASPIC [Gemmata massiliana]